MGGWLETDNRAISVQLNLTETATGTELGKNCFMKIKITRSISRYRANLINLVFISFKIYVKRHRFSYSGGLAQRMASFPKIVIIPIKVSLHEKVTIPGMITQACKKALNFLTPDVAAKNLTNTFCQISRD